MDDIDAMKRENEELRAAAGRHAERARRFARLRGLTARLAATLDRAAIFDEIVTAATDLFGAGAAALLLLDEQAQVMRLEAGQGLAMGSPANFPLGPTVAGHALATRRTIAVQNTNAQAETLIPALLDGARPGALIAAPIRVEGKPYGVIEVYYAQPRSIADEDVEMLDALSDAAAIALRNALAYARILQQGAELTRRNEELARQKEELARLNGELRRADVLKSQFLSTMSHELRTPLTSIIGFSTMLVRGRQGETLTERQRDNAERILASARHLVTLINDILDLSRIEAGRLDVFRREVDLAALLDDLCAELEPQAQAKRIYLRIEAGSGLERVTTDADRLRQILINLVANAIKFTFTGGVTVRAERADDAIVITVEDTGIGITPEEQEHIFDDFYQVDQSSTRAAGGTGLGLSIARRLVGLLHGRLSLHSVPREGSTFTVVLPATTDAQAIEEPAPSPNRALADGELRVLLIDDDPQMLVLLERALEGSPYRVSGALSADEGLSKARELCPDAILLDVMMPETDGWRTLHRLKSDPLVADIPVVMHTIVTDQALGFSLGATDYLVKPVERDRLLAVLNRLAPVERGPVLVVDDDEATRALLAEVMADEGVAVVVAANGVAALRLVAEQRPRVVVLDLMLPAMDGFEVLRRLRADSATRHIPIIVVTAKTLTREEEALLSRDACTVITKDGVPLELLLGEIRGALRVTS